MQRTTFRVLAGVAVATAALSWAPAAAFASAQARPAERALPAAAMTRAAAPVPAAAVDTLAKIDAGHWPPSDAPGTQGGANWPNQEGQLPVTGANGTQVHYRTWDVEAKQPGRARGPQRIVTGDDGSAWYTPDQYRTFTRMR
ncbi:ribonuclease domain-containing protein [Streptomyces sp. NBC_00083]|uniref:ribonuclease domain-containing protein n=1 Tax=Streptomyces sp. NBC_00083 TaxID=2975647 RepID=UPI00225A15E4|nr:ribonuclease domain-containing protein [Streptomyces sp. NBC_00083]MCX5385770.1 hypothetical protein [Streptomyces sp. NBC_00083]